MTPAHRMLAAIYHQYARAAEQMGGQFYLGADNAPDPVLSSRATGIFLMDEHRANGPEEFGNDWLFRFATESNAIWAVWEVVPDQKSALVMSMGSMMSGRPLIVIVTDKHCGPKWIEFVRPHWLVREGDTPGRCSFLPMQKEVAQ